MTYFNFTNLDPEWPTFNGVATPSSNSPQSDIFKAFGLSSREFVNRANALFQEYNVKVPQDYPKLRAVDRKYFGKSEVSPMNQFANCVASCIVIKDEFKYDVSKIIRDELIAPNSRHGILHADSLATIVLYYLRNGSQVVTPREVDGQSNPDLVIDGYPCEVKVIDESDWTRDIDPDTGQGKQRLLSEDICYDIGQFIGKRDSGHKGIKQSDVIFADLSFKSFGWIENITGKKNIGFPKLKKYIIIYFTKKRTNISSYYLEFESALWDLIKTTNAKHRFSIAPWSKSTTSE